MQRAEKFNSLFRPQFNAEMADFNEIAEFAGRAAAVWESGAKGY